MPFYWECGKEVFCSVDFEVDTELALHYKLRLNLPITKQCLPRGKAGDSFSDREP